MSIEQKLALLILEVEYTMNQMDDEDRLENYKKEAKENPDDPWYKDRVKELEERKQGPFNPSLVELKERRRAELIAKLLVKGWNILNRRT